MAWTFAQLKAAEAALSPQVADPADAAAALNAQTAPAGYQSVPIGSIQGVLLLAGEWSKIKRRAALEPSGSDPPTLGDQIIGVAEAAVDLVEGKPTEVSADHFSAFAAMVQLLVQAGDVSAASEAAIAALAQPSPTIPAWSPVVTAGDVQTARAQP